jgi:hypothetical protein
LFLSSSGLSSQQSILFSVVAGGLIALSGILCTFAGGPRLGNIVRTSLLLVLAAITYWQVQTTAALILLAAACVTGLLTVLGGEKAHTLN